jgi:hypothetical protein
MENGKKFMKKCEEGAEVLEFRNLHFPHLVATRTKRSVQVYRDRNLHPLPQIVTNIAV